MQIPAEGRAVRMRAGKRVNCTAQVSSCSQVIVKVGKVTAEIKQAGQTVFTAAEKRELQIKALNFLLSLPDPLPVVTRLG